MTKNIVLPSYAEKWLRENPYQVISHSKNGETIQYWEGSYKACCAWANSDTARELGETYQVVPMTKVDALLHFNLF